MICWQGEISALGLLRRIVSKVSSALPKRKQYNQTQYNQTQKWGKHRGVQARLATTLSRLAVPSIMLANVRSLDNKLDHISFMQASIQNMRLLCLHVYRDMAK